jgi:hypothetical protein
MLPFRYQAKRIKRIKRNPEVVLLAILKERFGCFGFIASEKRGAAPNSS